MEQYCGYETLWHTCAAYFKDYWYKWLQHWPKSSIFTTTMFLFSSRTLACSETTPWLVRISASYLSNVSHLQRKVPSCSLSSSFLLDFTQSLRRWPLNLAPEKSLSSLLHILPSLHWTLFLWIIISCCSNTKLSSSLSLFEIRPHQQKLVAGHFCGWSWAASRCMLLSLSRRKRKGKQIQLCSLQSPRLVFV